MITPERRAARADIPVRIYRLGDEPPDTWLASELLAAMLDADARFMVVGAHARAAGRMKDLAGVEALGE